MNVYTIDSRDQHSLVKAHIRTNGQWYLEGKVGVSRREWVLDDNERWTATDEHGTPLTEEEVMARIGRAAVADGIYAND